MPYRISVLTPSYNSVAYIERAIESVLVQNSLDFEHIIMDGGSTDGTVEVLKKYPHLKWTSESDKGQSDAMNKAFSKATGDLIVYLNADDYFLPGAFAAVLKMLEENPQAEMVIGGLSIQSENGHKGNHFASALLDEILLFHRFNFPLNPVCYFYRKSVQEKIGIFPSVNHYTMDYWFLLRAYQFATICKSDEILGVYWFSENNKSVDIWMSYNRLLETYLDFMNENPELPKDKYTKEVFREVVEDWKRTKNTLETIYQSTWWKFANRISSFLHRR